MARIDSYSPDTLAAAPDTLLGFDKATGKTVNFSVDVLADAIAARFPISRRASDGHIVYTDSSGVVDLTTTAAATGTTGSTTGTTTTTPPAGGTTSGPDPVQNPAPVVTAPPAADPINFTQGSNTFTSTNVLADFNSTSPVTVGSETVTAVTSGTPFAVQSALKFNVQTITNEVGLDKDLSRTNTRDFKANFALDSGANLSNEETIFHAYTDNYGAGLVQIRIAPSGSGFNFLLRAEGGNNFATQFKKSTVVYLRNTSLALELYVSDNAFSLLVNGVLIIEWYNGTDTAGTYYAISNVGKYIGGLSIGKFYSASLSGIFYYQNIRFYQDYVAPTGPATEAGKVQDAWLGWKKRYLRADGAVVRPFPEGYTGNYQPGSDVVSEGTAYGQFFAVQMNDQTTFDLIETWVSAHLTRNNFGGLTGQSLMAWHWDDIGNTAYDQNWATDADMDRVAALIWAAKRKTRGDAGWATSSINYASKAAAVIADLKQYAFRTDTNGNAYLGSDSFQLGADPMEINLSYHSVAAMRIILNYNGDSFWQTAINGSYDVITKSSVGTLSDSLGAGTQTGVGLVPDWVGYSVSAHNITQTPPNNRAVKFSYDAFRTNHRVYWDYFLFGAAQAKTFLTGPIRTFYLGQWAANGAIYAEYNHNGTVLGQYEKTMMTAGAALTLLAAGNSDTVAASIISGKLSNTYRKNYVGGFYADNAVATGAFVGAPSYFNCSWALMFYMIQNGYFINYT